MLEAIALLWGSISFTLLVVVALDHHSFYKAVVKPTAKDVPWNSEPIAWAMVLFLLAVLGPVFLLAALMKLIKRPA